MFQFAEEQQRQAMLNLKETAKDYELAIDSVEEKTLCDIERVIENNSES